jgi:uncharacterized membrane protein
MSEIENPLRSEAAMFRVVVIVGIAAIPVIALGALAGPAWGAVALAIELALGAGLIWRRWRGRAGA